MGEAIRPISNAIQNRPMNWIKFAFLLSAVLMLREAFSETAGILLVGNGADWIAIKNVVLLLLDLVLGVGILLSIFLNKEDFPNGLALGMVLLAMTLHAGRMVEYIFTPEIAYCYCPEMFWMNNLKLGSLILAMGLAFLFETEKNDSNNLKKVGITKMGQSTFFKTSLATEPNTFFSISSLLAIPL